MLDLKEENTKKILDCLDDLKDKNYNFILVFGKQDKDSTSFVTKMSCEDDSIVLECIKEITKTWDTCNTSKHF